MILNLWSRAVAHQACAVDAQITLEACACTPDAVTTPTTSPGWKEFTPVRFLLLFALSHLLFPRTRTLHDPFSSGLARRRCAFSPVTLGMLVLRSFYGLLAVPLWLAYFATEIR